MRPGGAARQPDEMGQDQTGDDAGSEGHGIWLETEAMIRYLPAVGAPGTRRRKDSVRRASGQGLNARHSRCFPGRTGAWTGSPEALGVNPDPRGGEASKRDDHCLRRECAAGAVVRGVLNPRGAPG
ncbi:protein of unknown function [Candidatus Methylocalor cossyra]|uniref:Uncharacterized protein n=1 Tax=Candidatus Methylocalor cossyra TaxID=3108543 RepID=A0ABM9NIF5_9GAMM